MINNSIENKKTAVVFVTDAGFLIPSISAALQISNQERVMEIADIFIYLIDFKVEIVEQLRLSFSQYDIGFKQMDPSIFLPPIETYFNKTHVPRSALGRFAIQYELPLNYENVVYIDGDVQIIGDIFPLVAHKVKSGYIAAVNESLWLCSGDVGKFWTDHKKYLRSINLSDPEDYFNSGILAFRLDTWRDMAPKALAYFNENPTLCKYHDQSALNAIFLGKREVLPPIYNFNSFFSALGVTDKVKPSIVHFTGGCKPWFFPGPPWNGQFISQYETLVANHEVLQPFFKRPDEIAVKNLENRERMARLRRIVMMPWRNWLRRRAFIRYIKETKFSVI